MMDWWDTRFELFYIMQMMDNQSFPGCQICDEDIISGQTAMIMMEFEPIEFAHLQCIKDNKPCPQCRTRGWVYIDPPDPSSFIVGIGLNRRSRPCDRCDGKGIIPREKTDGNTTH